MSVARLRLCWQRRSASRETRLLPACRLPVRCRAATHRTGRRCDVAHRAARERHHRVARRVAVAEAARSLRRTRTSCAVRAVQAIRSSGALAASTHSCSRCITGRTVRETEAAEARRLIGREERREAHALKYRTSLLRALHSLAARRSCCAFTRVHSRSLAQRSCFSAAPIAFRTQCDPRGPLRPTADWMSWRS